VFVTLRAADDGFVICILGGRHHGAVAVHFEHERIRELEDRDWTLTLLDEVRSTSASEAEREEALQTLSYLEDYRSIPPLTGMVADDQLPESLREYASDVLRGFDDTTTPERRRAWWATGDPVIMAHALRVMERSEADIVAPVASDDEHPLQAVALRAMAFGFDEAEFQPVKIRALAHRDPEVREAAADVLLWDEPVAAEQPLLTAASDPSSDVAAAAVDTLQYYRSRRVLRAVAEMVDVEDPQVRAKAAETFASLRESFDLA
jgi:HEAT repeat protein